MGHLGRTQYGLATPIFFFFFYILRMTILKDVYNLFELTIVVITNRL